MDKNSRSPHGERGLKCGGSLDRSDHTWSLPSRGAWIEMGNSSIFKALRLGRSPHGERGLKSVPSAGLSRAGTVAPLTGSVD